ncbi:ATP-dependent Clp protease proteolytic subunit, partial [Myxococcota bacterium]|nr:ATP-dependent Clp protease proteolytic subunit [Myxococcota bacterium]
MRPNSLWLARFRRAILFFAAMVWFGFASNFAGSSPEESTSVPTVRTGSISLAQISGSINPASSDYLQKAIRQSEEENSALLVIELDTPGGLVASTKDIIQAMLNSNIPIVVYVSPRGAWAGSAGTFITMAAHVAAMAPGSSIGAAHPVGIGGGGKPQQDQDGKEGPKDYSAQKAENLLAAFIESIAERRGRNVEWAEKAVRDSVAITAPEALEIGVIDLIAEDRAELIALLDGWEVASLSGKEVLDLSGSSIKKLEMSLLT